MRQFPLPPRHEELLHKTFGQDQWREDKKLAGFSGASVYQIIYRNNPVVVKIAPPAVIQREQAGYHDFVLDNLHHHAPKLGGYYESDDQQEAILRYTYAGSVARSQTLFEFLERPSQKAVKEVCTILEKMFTLNQNDHPKSWWERAERKSIRSAEYYDRWLPVQLVLEQLPAVVEGATLLQAQRLSLTDIAALTAGDFVLLQDFQVEKQEAGVVTLYAGRPQAPSLRVKVRGIQSDHTGVFPALYAVVKETRSMLLETYVEEAVGAFAMHAPRLTVEGHEYHNPFYYLDELLNTRHDAYLATIHGDFNLRNILLEEKSQPGANAFVRSLTNFFGQKSYDWWLIDFASAQTGPVLLDLQWLEAQVINWLLVPALQRTGQGPQTLAQILEGLQRRRALYFQLRTGELRAVYSLLQEIRRLAEGYLAEPAHNPDRWQEYYRGLTLALAATLKQEALSNELGHQAKKFALVAAATTVRWTGVKLVAPVKQGWQPLFGRWLAATLVGLLAVAGIYITIQLLWPKATTSTTAPVISTAPPATLTSTPVPATPTPTSAPAVVAVPTEPASILAEVQSRGHLRCGVNGHLPLFSWDPAIPKHANWNPATPVHIDNYKNAVGFDADFCRVIAVALWDDPTRVEFVNLGAKERFQAVANGVVDVLARNTTWTPDRDHGLGIDFAAINFYTKQGLIVPKSLNFKSWRELAGKRICVLPGTTTYANAAALQQKMGWELVSRNDNAPKGFDNTRQAVEALKAQNYCEAFTSDIAQLTAFHRKPNPGEDMPYLSPDEYEILAIDDPAIPDEPYALIVAENDNQWRQIVSYAVWATIYAEELGITQENVQNFDATAELHIKEFLGLPDPLIPVGGQIGELLGLSPAFARNIINQVGNYGDIFTSHLAAYFTTRGPNQSIKLAPAGRLFTPPFVLAQLATPTPMPITIPAPELTIPPTRVPITIGVAIDLDGSELLLGEDQNKAALLASDFFSQTIPGVQIVVKVVNAGNTPEKAATAMHKLIDEHQVVAISGPTLSSQALQADQIPNAAGVPIIGPSNTVPGIPELGCYVARIPPSVELVDPLALIGAAQRLPRGGNVVVAYRNDNEFTIAEAQVFTETLAAKHSDYRFDLKATVVYTKEADFTEKAALIRSYQPDLIMIAGLPKDGGTLVFELRQQGYDSYVIGGNGFNTSRIFEVCEDCGKILLAQAFDSRAEDASPMHEQFITRYQQSYQERPSPIAAQMFSAIQVLVEALATINEQAPITGATVLPDLRDRINQRLLSGQPFADTPLGAIAFARNGEILQSHFYLAETQVDAQGQWYFGTFAERENEALDPLRAAPADCPAGYLP